MYCGNCLRDNALVAELRRLGHSALMIPLYLPITLDEANQSQGTPVFFGGVNVFLDQKSALYRRAPSWMRRVFDSEKLLRWAAGRAAKTRATDVGDLMLSMLRGEDGNQARDLDELVSWLGAQSQRPDVICLSNALLAGMARQLRSRLGAPVMCMLQGEDAYVESLPPAFRDRAWAALQERAGDISQFITTSRYYAELMSDRLRLPPGRVRVVHAGINLEGYPKDEQPRSEDPSHAAVLGYFARMCPDKGLHLLVDAFIELKRRNRVPGLRLKVGGGCGPSDESFVAQQREKLSAAGLADWVEFHPNLDRAQKLAFYRSLTVFSVPALYGEAFGLYVVEAMVSGVPVVQPRHGAFPELIEATGGGLICEPSASSIADGLECLLMSPERRRALAKAGREAALRLFSVSESSRQFLDACHEVIRRG